MRRKCVEHTIVEMENETGTDREAALADMRFQLHREPLRRRPLSSPAESREHHRSVELDKHPDRPIHRNPHVSSSFMALVFWLTFGVIGAGLSDLIDAGHRPRSPHLVDAGLTAYGINPVAAFPGHRRRLCRAWAAC